MILNEYEYANINTQNLYNLLLLLLALSVHVQEGLSSKLRT